MSAAENISLLYSTDNMGSIMKEIEKNRIRMEQLRKTRFVELNPIKDNSEEKILNQQKLEKTRKLRTRRREVQKST